MSRDDDLCRLSERLPTHWLGRPHLHLEQTGSTNDEAAAWARRGASHGAIVTADAQHAGRGRRGRRWSSPPGANVYASLVLRPPPVATGFGALALVVALGIRQGLGDVPRLTIKWPNDLLLHGRKVAGILCECRWMGAQPEVVVGFGINVLSQRFPDELVGVATCLAEHGVTGGRAEVLTRALQGLEPALDTFFAHGFRPLRAAYRRHCPWIGGTIDWTDAEGQRRRVDAVDIEPDGTLLVRDAGRLRKLEAGEIGLAPP